MMWQSFKTGLTLQQINQKIIIYSTTGKPSSKYLLFFNPHFETSAEVLNTIIRRKKLLGTRKF